MIYTKIDKNKILEWLKNNLTDEKYIHSIGAMECAIELAEYFGIDTEKAQTAGLLHDCAKNFNEQKSLDLIKNYNIEITSDELECFKTLHAPIGSYLAKHQFGVDDIEILTAIRFHTIGNFNMSKLEKIIFIADKIEPNTRPDKIILPVREVLFNENGLDLAMLFLYKRTIKHLLKKDLKLSAHTVEMYNTLLKFV